MKIGLTYTGNSKDEQKNTNYKVWLKGGDENIEIVVLSIDDKINEGNIKECNALVLSGGVDIHPKYYGSQKLDYNNNPKDFKPERDEFEISLFKIAQENNLPVLGVCRGFQLINCFFDGDLEQDLGIELNKIHWRIDESKKDEFDKAHGVNIESGTLLSEVTGVERSVANSAHHQAIKKLADKLKINCKADDGTVEGFEWLDKSNKSFLLCIQWHPERMYKFNLSDSPLSKNIRDRFIEETEKSIAIKNGSYKSGNRRNYCHT